MTTAEMKQYLALNKKELDAGTHLAIYGRVIETTATQIFVLCVGASEIIKIDKTKIKNRFTSSVKSFEQLFLIENVNVQESDEQSKVNCSKKISKLTMDLNQDLKFKDVTLM